MNRSTNELQKILDKAWEDNKPARDYYQKLEELRIASISKDGFVTAVYNGMLDLVDIQTSTGFATDSIKDAVNSGLLRAINAAYELRDQVQFEPDEFLQDITRHKEKY
jgi:DNA-binding protein YbaB